MTREEFIQRLKNSGLSKVEQIARLNEFDEQQTMALNSPDLGLGKPTDPANVKEATVGSEDTASSSDFGTLASRKPKTEQERFKDFDTEKKRFR